MGNQVVRLLHVTSCGQRDQIMIKLLDYEYYAFEGVASAAAILFLLQSFGFVQTIRVREKELLPRVLLGSNQGLKYIVVESYLNFHKKDRVLKGLLDRPHSLQRNCQCYGKRQEE